jgi:hypothetical protein
MIPEDQRPDVILVRKVHQKSHGNDGASEMTGITRDMEELELE